MTDTRSFHLISDLVRSNALAAVLAAEPESVVTVKPKGRTVDQNAKMWAMLADVAREAPEGHVWPVETWKAAFMHYLGHQVQFCEGLDNCGPFPVGFRTSRMTVKQMADLITCIDEYGTRHGVVWREMKDGGFID